MKKKILIFFTTCILSFMLFSGNDELKLRVVPLSATQWQSVQNQVNTNGWCHIKEQNVLLMITNGCPNIEHWFPIGRGPDKKKKVKSSPEPSPYIGQSMIMR